MARFMVGTGGFEYRYDTGRKSIDLSLLATMSGVGVLLFGMEYLVSLPGGGAPLALSWPELAARAGLAEGAFCGVHEAPPGEDPQTSFEGACAAEGARVAALIDSLAAPKPLRIELRAQAEYRLLASDWGRMLEWLNTFLPVGLRITVDTVRGFDLAALARFDPDEDGEGDEALGTRHISFLCAANAERYLPYLALRVLAHAVQQNLETMIVEETDRLWRGVVWTWK